MQKQNVTNDITTQQEPKPVIYRLGSLEIWLQQGAWRRTHFFGEPNCDVSHSLVGYAWLEDGFLCLTSWKVRSPASFENPLERDTYLATLPPWPLELAMWGIDRGNWGRGRLIDCRTGKPADLRSPGARAALKQAKVLDRKQSRITPQRQTHQPLNHEEFDAQVG